MPRANSSPSAYKSHSDNKKSQDKSRISKWETEESDNNAPRSRSHSFGSSSRKNEESGSKYQINTHTRAVFGTSDSEGNARKPRVKRGSYDSTSDSDDSRPAIASQLSELQSYLHAQRQKKEMDFHKFSLSISHFHSQFNFHAHSFISTSLQKPYPPHSPM